MAPGGVDGEGLHAETVSELCREEEEGGKEGVVVKYEGRLQSKEVPGEEEADAWKAQASLPTRLCF